jgi:hypothetical protein
VGKPWEITHMTTTVKADNRSRVTLRGAEDGRQYLVSEQGGGWFVRPTTRTRRRGISGGEFRQLWQSRAALDEATAAEVAQNIQATSSQPCCVSTCWRAIGEDGYLRPSLSKAGGVRWRLKDAK